MRNWTRLVLSFLVLLLPAAGWALPDRLEVMNATSIPDLAFSGERGAYKKLSDFKGKIVLIKVWSVNCGHCIQEMPSLDQMMGKFSPQDLEVVSLNVDPADIPLEKIRTFLEKDTPLRFVEFFRDPKKESKSALGWHAFPTTFILNRDGNLVGKLVGRIDWLSDEALEMVKRYISGTPLKPRLSLWGRLTQWLRGLFSL